MKGEAQYHEVGGEEWEGDTRRRGGFVPGSGIGSGEVDLAQEMIGVRHEGWVVENLGVPLDSFKLVIKGKHEI